MAIAALVLGILAVAFGWVPYFGGIMGLLATIFGAVCIKKRIKLGMAITGLVCGIIALTWNVVVIVALIEAARTLRL